jgi:2-desacetyl-2-hydroxyethyl bacteriochlorophyllide A dehydrogenase
MTDSDAHAFWVVGPGRGEIRAETLPPLADDDVLVRTLHSGISRGTETLVFTGRVPSSEHGRMRAPFQQGEFPAPVKYGYVNVGVVEQGPADLRGREVFCLYPHQTRYVVPRDAVYPLPAGVPAGRAVLAANLQTAVNALWDAEIKVGDRVAVVGAGTVGCLVAWLASRIPACDVELIDVDRQKAAAATELGVAFRGPGDARSDADVVFHASGTPAGLATSLAIAGFEAPVVELSWYGDRDVPVRLGEAFHSRRLSLRASQVATLPASQRSRWTHRRRNELALELLRDARLDALISGQSTFDELPDVLTRLSQSSDGVLCHRIDYS